MPLNQIAQRYALALFQTTENHPEVAAELSALNQVFSKNSDVEKFFLSPVVSIDDKRAALSDLKTKFSKTFNFIDMLLEAGRISELPWIEDEFKSLCEAKAGELSVELESAQQLSDANIEDIRNLLQEKWKRKLKFNTKINAELIGGFVARAPGKVFDASVATQLESLKEKVLA